ncbi:type I-E CRISPR-associated protein Cas6/Cse3/CasE [uncultured Allobaculum sp.]|uniref:type I-E CRISPR-associated protein Cas6/Cse3/CasE n=1 Tax=uncultured Allobaculum sp. TaxID=1187017 RepID=UPI0025893B74|nr:type I-E CRISPR-associated protein Cas6/Cse3/CasE [uncultured Allobaculum sp.]
MILTRVKLDTGLRKTLKALSNPNVFHGAVELSQTGNRDRLLWRVDILKKQYYLLILSRRPLDGRVLADQFCRSDSDVESKDYSLLLDRVTEGSKWRFKLAANPTFSVPQDKGRERGKVVSPFRREDQLNWLKKHAEKNGFTLEEGQYDVAAVRQLRIKKYGQKSAAALQEVVYEGMLTVSDPEKLKLALVNGIGRGKAYGMGLMTLVSCHG